MGLFKKPLTVNEAINRSRTEKDAVLIDVRSKNTYREGHVAGSINIPLDHADMITTRVPSKDTTLYVIGSVYAKPQTGVKKFKALGYKNVVLGSVMEDHHGLLQHG